MVGALLATIVLAAWMAPARAQEQPPAGADPNLQLPPPPETPVAAESVPSIPPPPVDPAIGSAPDMAPPEQKAAEQPAPPAPVQTPAASVQPPTDDFMVPYIFDTREGRRNPFRAMVLREEEQGPEVGPVTPLERYDIDELKLLAIMWDVKNPRAMVMDPNKEIHYIGKDDRIGRRQGYVATIREGELVVVETSDYNGETVYSTRVMKIEK